MTKILMKITHFISFVYDISFLALLRKLTNELFLDKIEKNLLFNYEICKKKF